MPRGSKTVYERLPHLAESRKIAFSENNSESPKWVFGDDDVTERAWECLACGHEWNATPRSVFARKNGCPYCRKGSDAMCPREAKCASCLSRSAACPEVARLLEEAGIRILRGPNGETPEEMRVVRHARMAVSDGVLSSFECAKCGKLFRDLLPNVVERTHKCIGCDGAGDFFPRVWDSERARGRFEDRFDACEGITIYSLRAEFDEERVRFLRGPDGETDEEMLVDPEEKRTTVETSFSTFYCLECGKMWRERAHDVAKRNKKCKGCGLFAEFKPREWKNGAPVIRRGHIR